jgi:hypothetical protein
MDRFLKGNWKLGVTLDNYKSGNYDGNMHVNRKNIYVVPQTKVGKIISKINETRNLDYCEEIFNYISKVKRLIQFITNHDYIMPLPSPSNTDFNPNYEIAKVIGKYYYLTYLSDMFRFNGDIRTNISNYENIVNPTLTLNGSVESGQLNHNTLFYVNNLYEIDKKIELPSIEISDVKSHKLDNKRVLLFNAVYYNGEYFNEVTRLLNKTFNNIEVNIFTLSKAKKRKFTWIESELIKDDFQNIIKDD